MGALSQLIKRRIDRVTDARKLRHDYLRSLSIRAAESVVPSVIRRQKYFAIYFHPGVCIPRRRQARLPVQDAGEPESPNVVLGKRSLSGTPLSRARALSSSPSYPRRMREQKVEA